MRFRMMQSNELLLTTHAGLSTVGILIEHTQLSQRLNQTKVKDAKFPLCSHADVMKSYIGLLCQGKSDFDHIEPSRQDDMFALYLHLQKVPSSPTLRQRLEQAAASAPWDKILLEESAGLLRKVQAPLT